MSVNIDLLPKRVLEEGGGHFNSIVFKSWCSNKQVACHSTTSYRKHTSGSIERAQGILVNRLRKLSLCQQKGWTSALSQTISTINNSPNGIADCSLICWMKVCYVDGRTIDTEKLLRLRRGALFNFIQYRRKLNKAVATLKRKIIMVTIIHLVHII